MVIGLLLTALVSLTPFNVQKQGASHVLVDSPSTIYWETEFNTDFENTNVKIYKFNINTSNYESHFVSYNPVSTYYDLRDQRFIYNYFQSSDLYTASNVGYVAVQHNVNNYIDAVFNEGDLTEYTARFNTWFRVYLPYTTPVNAVEFLNRQGDVFVCKGGCTNTYYNGMAFQGLNHIGSNSKEIWGGLYYQNFNDNTGGNSNNISVEGSTYTDNLGKFSEYLIGFSIGEEDMGYDLAISLSFQYIDTEYFDSDYTNGYLEGQRLGYQKGYNDGNHDGYNNGYADARDYYSTHDTSFHGLMSAIADTPLRMLYGLFNFDLFGVSMLVVVLTTLTGIVLFAIIKRFYK